MFRGLKQRNVVPDDGELEFDYSNTRLSVNALCLFNSDGIFLFPSQVNHRGCSSVDAKPSFFFTSEILACGLLWAVFAFTCCDIRSSSESPFRKGEVEEAQNG